MSGTPRSTAARIGVTALNLLWPGLGLLRLQRLKSGMRLLATPFLLTLVSLLIFEALPIYTFDRWAAMTAAFLVLALTFYGIAIVLSWRASRWRAPTIPWWSRWYSLAGFWIALMAAYWPTPDIYQSYYRTFYMPAESMEPVLMVGDRLVARMRPPWIVQRGSIVIVETTRGQFYIKRVAALGGDRIAMRDGIVILNCRPIPQRLVERVQGQHPWGEPATISRLAEQFPGESRPHQILDSGTTAFDEMPEQRVAPANLFLLGDNRDHSTDSRVPVAQLGLEQVPMSAIRGQPLFYYWGSDNSRMGEPLNR